MSKPISPQKPDHREALTWWPHGYCSAWNEKRKACTHSPACICRKRTPSQGGKE